MSIRWRKPSSPCYARKRFGLTQQQLADILGVSRSLVTMMEQGKRKLPGEAKSIYRRLCEKGNELPSMAVMPIKRGRKPKGSNPNLPFVPPVSKYRVKNFDTKKNRALRRKWIGLKNTAMPSLETLAVKARKEPGCDAFTHKLEERKNQLLHVYKLLEFKKEIREQRHAELSARMAGMNKKQDYLKSLEEMLPGDRLKRKIEYLDSCNSYQQFIVSEELKKWDVHSLLKTELQMNGIMRQVGLTDELIAALTDDRKGSVQYCLSSEIAA